MLHKSLLHQFWLHSVGNSGITLSITILRYSESYTHFIEKYYVLGHVLSSRDEAAGMKPACPDLTKLVPPWLFWFGSLGTFLWHLGGLFGVTKTLYNESLCLRGVFLLVYFHLLQLPESFLDKLR